MAKEKSLMNTSPSTPGSVVPSSTNVPPVLDNCVSDSKSASLNKPDLGAVVDKADSSSSHNISISSINEDYNNDSSAFETSDSECDDEQIKKAIERIPHSLQPGGQLIQNGTLVVKDDDGTPTAARGPNIGSIAVQNSSDITFGNKTYIKGQVVIKNIYPDRQNGLVNRGYNETDGELGVTKSRPDSPPEPQTWISSLKTIVKHKPLLSAIILVALMIIITTIVIVLFVAIPGKRKLKRRYGDGDDDRAYVPPETGIEQDFFPDPKPLRIVTRNEWLAQPPKEELTLLELPVHRVIIAHTATENCTTQRACVKRIRDIQQNHLKSFSDIGYNFLIGGDGNVYEGRGWLKVGAFLRGQNSKSEGIAFIGDYQELEPTEAQMDALNSLLVNGANIGCLKPNFKLYGARQWKETISPGALLYERLSKHPHYSADLI